MSDDNKFAIVGYEVIPLNNKETLSRKIVNFTGSVIEVKHELTKNFKIADTTPVQYNILEYILFSQPVTLSQISDCLHISMPNASREMKKLIDKGLCEKFSVPEDRRKQLIKLSPKGQNIMDKTFNRVEESIMQRLQEASSEELEQINEAINLLHRRLFYTDQYS